MLEVELVVTVPVYGHRKWPKRNEAVTGAASEAFARWLHH